MQLDNFTIATLRDKIIENENLFLMKIGYNEKVI